MTERTVEIAISLVLAWYEWTERSEGMEICNKLLP